MSRSLIKESVGTLFCLAAKAMIRCFCLSAKAMHLAARCVPLARCGLFVILRRCLFIPCNALCHCEAPLCGAVAISRKGHRITKPTQDTFVLAWRKKAQTSKRVSIDAPTMRFQKRSYRGPHGILVPVGLWTCTFPLFSTYTVFTLEA